MLPAPHQLLDFWFDDAHAPYWFAKSDAFDAVLRERFGHTAEAAAQGQLDGWVATPTGWLALLILLDQCSRNLYRDDTRAWAQDARAQRLALAGIERGADFALPPLQRVFAYLPLEHAEELDLQQRSVALFEALVADAPAGQSARFEGFADHARRHHALIARFGRFPHRNAVLGRPSSVVELAYLARPGAGF